LGRCVGGYGTCAGFQGVGALKSAAYFVFHRYYSTDWQEIASRKTAARRFWRDRGGAGEKSRPGPLPREKKPCSAKDFI